MSAGISRVHGYAALPSQRPSTISFYTITLTGVNASTTTYTQTPNGVWDQIFRTAVDQFATVAMIGTPVYAASNTTLNFAIEDTGVDANSVTGLGEGSSENGAWSSGAAFGATTAAALTNAIASLGTVQSINLASAASVAAGVNGGAF